MKKTLEMGIPFAQPLVESVSDGFFAFDLQLNCVFWSPGMERISGHRMHEVIGRKIAPFVRFMMKGSVEGALARVLDGQAFTEYNQSYYIQETNRRGVLECFYSPMKSQEKHVIGGVVVIKDVTELKHAQEELIETETRFRRMADCSPVLLWMSGTDSLCYFFNQTWLDFTGRTLEQEKGVGWAEGIYFEDFQACMDTYIEAFNARRAFEMEYRLKRKDGQYRWILDRGVPRYTPRGEFAGYVGSCVDIDDRKRLEEQLKEAVRIRDEFLSIASHELKTPLTSLTLQVQMLQMKSQKDEPLSAEQAQRFSAILEKQIEKLNDLITDLLDVSSIEAGKLDLKLESGNLSQLVDTVAERLSKIFSEAGCELRVEKPEALTGRWDLSRIDQVLVNLLTNAAKYGAKKPILLKVSKSESGVKISVKDQGIGIEKHQMPKIFDRFARAVSSKHFGGLGLGLYISRQIVEAHHGTIGVESTLGAGSEFVVSLPLRT